MKEQVHGNVASLLPDFLAGCLILQACKSVLTARCQGGVKQEARARQSRCHKVALLGDRLQACGTLLTASS